VFDRMVEPLLILLLTHVEGVAHTGLIDRAAANLAGVLGEGDGVGWTDELRWSIADQMITTVVDVLDLAGVLRWDGAVVDHEGDDDGYEVVVRSGGFVALTPAGRWLVAEIARDRGLDVTAPRLTAASFADLVPAIVGQPFPVFAAELEAWLAARPPGIAVDELVAFAATADAAQRTMALAALSMLTEPEAGLDDIPGSRHRLPAPAVVERVRSLLEEPAARGAALVWLSERGGVRPEALVDPDPAVLTDVLLNALVLGGPTRVVEVLRLAGDPGAQIARVQQMTAVESPSVPTVLDVLGAEHPIAAVAKACRKAALQNRSRMLVG
jgi:hypothetical protein